MLSFKDLQTVDILFRLLYLIEINVFHIIINLVRRNHSAWY